jgi:hypothetical protein
MLSVASGSVVVKALRYKPACRGFDSGRSMALGSTQTLTEMSTKCFSWG